MRVIVTRPRRDAQAWVDAITAAGHEALAWPLIDIRTVPDPAPVQRVWQNLSAYERLMFVSANAVDAFFDTATASVARFNQHATLRAWATGPGTAAALVRAGVAPSRIDAPAADSAQMDTEALWARVGQSVRVGQPVLIVRGTDGAQDHATQGVGRDWLAEQLRQAGAVVEFLVVYERGLPDWPEAQRTQVRQAAEDGSLWLFSSSQAVAHLQALMPGQSWQHARALATHPRIAQAVRQAGFGQVREVRPLLPDALSSIESLP